jgi:hypothetical protein
LAAGLKSLTLLNPLQPQGGRTKEKIARVAGSRMDMSERNGQSKLEIRGTAQQRRKTMKYVKCVMAQRVGPVHVEDDDQDDDLTLAEVPTECVGFVTGKQVCTQEAHCAYGNSRSSGQARSEHSRSPAVRGDGVPEMQAGGYQQSGSLLISDCIDSTPPGQLPAHHGGRVGRDHVLRGVQGQPRPRAGR